MSQIGEIKKLSDTRFLNFYEFEAVHRDGMSAPYFVASRAKKIEQLKAVSHENKPDGVILFGVYGEKKDRVVLVRQYRYPLGDYVYEFPAGLVESGEDMVAAGIREMYEETGLTYPGGRRRLFPAVFHHHRHDRRKLRHRIRLLQRRTDLGASGVVGGHSGAHRRPGGVPTDPA